MFVIPTTQARHLAKKLNSHREFHAIFPALNRDARRSFSDGEVYVRIPESKNLTNQHVVVLHAGAPNPNKGLQETELILQILRDCEAKPIDIFFSYFPYGMQDRVFDKGETNVAENIVDKLVAYYGVRNIYIVDAHFLGRQWVKKYPISHVSAIPLLIEAVEKEYGEDLIFISPDVGSKRRTGIPGFTKKRFSSNIVQIYSSGERQNKMQGKTIVIVDDIIQTGGTLLSIYKECKKLGAKDVIAVVSHGLLNYGITNIKNTYSKLYLSNTISRKKTNVEISPLIAQTLLKDR